MQTNIYFKTPMLENTDVAGFKTCFSVFFKVFFKVFFIGMWNPRNSLEPEPVEPVEPVKPCTLPSTTVQFLSKVSHPQNGWIPSRSRNTHPAPRSD